jgi:hypothetical protein
MGGLGRIREGLVQAREDRHHTVNTDDGHDRITEAAPTTSRTSPPAASASL